MKVKSNLEYLRKSVENKESLDSRYMSLKMHKSLNEMVETTKQIKELLITIKTLNKNNISSEKIYSELKELVLNELGNKSEFNCFINACDSAISTIKSNPETLKSIVNLYLQYRDISEYTPKEWIQAMIDKGAQRSLGIIGQQKVIDIAIQIGFVFSETSDIFFNNPYSVAYYSKNLKQIIIPGINFGSQSKDLDVIFKVNEYYIFLEAKHIKESGGAQDKQIKELIELLNIDLPKNIFLISYLDGVYSNYLLDLTDQEIINPEAIKQQNLKSKVLQQRYEIILSLKKNKRGFWTNTAGLIDLLKDFIE